ncbi:MAG TPA: sodium-dependent transporter [Bacteroidales bacterium]|nr:MAG: Na+-dependent transporter [Bacteroidetes bacterium GWF2_33_38]HBF88423.1 sodium-dependent transporter [Bacteroidales bacterium]
MANIESSGRDGFTSKFGVLAAAAGSAIGLGNVWRFPYLMGQNGGAAFLIIYLGIVLGIGVSVMLSEFIIGRSAGQNAYGAFKKLSPKKPWFLVGFMGIVAAFVILAFYSTIAGWTLEYIYLSAVDAFSGKSSDDLQSIFVSFTQSDIRPLIWQLIFMAITAWIVYLGIQKGIEKYSKILMPSLFIILLILCVRSLTLENASVGLNFMFNPDFSKIDSSVILNALGQAFFSLSVGMGALITYGSYVNKSNNLSNTSFQVSIADTLVAILAGVVIFPAVFSFGLDPKEGPGLAFVVLPNIFQQMTGGVFFAVLFFLLLAIAALTSTISVLEVVVAYFIEELKMSRLKATIISSFSISIIGVFCTLSFGAFRNFKIFEKTIFDLMDFFASNILLPLGGLLIVVYVGWFLNLSLVKSEVTNEGTLKGRFFGVFIFIIRFVAPLAIMLVFLNGLGIFN